MIKFSEIRNKIKDDSLENSLFSQIMEDENENNDFIIKINLALNEVEICVDSWDNFIICIPKMIMNICDIFLFIDFYSLEKRLLYVVEYIIINRININDLNIIRKLNNHFQYKEKSEAILSLEKVFKYDMPEYLRLHNFNLTTLTYNMIGFYDSINFFQTKNLFHLKL